MKILFYYKNLIIENRVWLKKTAAWAVLWFVLGVGTFLARPDSSSYILEMMEKIFREIFQGQELGVDMASVLLIFKNNFQSALIVLFAGIILGLIPFLSVAFNFFLLGYLFAFLAYTAKAQGLLIFALTVLPHGVVEIPALLLASAFGLRLGFFWRLNLPVSDWKKLKICLKDNLKLVPLLFLAFVLAAFLEIFVSGRLASSFLPLDGGG